MTDPVSHRPRDTGHQKWADQWSSRFFKIIRGLEEFVNPTGNIAKELGLHRKVKREVQLFYPKKRYFKEEIR